MSGKWYTGLTTKRDALQSEKFGFGIPAAAEDGRGRFHIGPACGAGNTGGCGIGRYNLNSSPVLQPSAGGQCPPLQVFSRRRSRRATESKLSTLMKNSTKKEGATMKQCKRHLTDREVFWLAMAAAAVAWLLL